jgi:hypothetical protein
MEYRVNDDAATAESHPSNANEADDESGQSSDGDSAEVMPPAETETVGDPIERMSSSDIVPPSSTSRTKMFYDAEVQTITTCCKSIISGGIMSAEKVKEALSASRAGSELLRKYKVGQIITRIAYERRKRKIN